MIKNITKIIIIVLVSFFWSGCARPQAEEVKIILPPPPEDPKIFFVGTYRGESSFKERSWLDAFIGEGVFAASDLYKPYGIAVFGDIISVSDTAANIIYVIDTAAKKVSFVGNNSVGMLGMPAGLAYDKRGNLYAADAKMAKVFGYKPDGELAFAIGTKGEFIRPTGIAVNKELERLYIVDTKAHNIKVYSLTGDPLFDFGQRGVKDGEFNYPTNIAVDRRNNNIVIVDTQNFRVQIFDKDGNFITKFGSVGDKPGNFSRPKGIGVDSDGHIYVADAAFSNIQIFDEQGNVLLYFGGKGKAPGQFTLIAGVYIDEKDRIHVVDSFNARVQVYQYVSEEWKNNNPEAFKKLKLNKNP